MKCHPTAQAQQLKKKKQITVHVPIGNIATGVNMVSDL